MFKLSCQHSFSCRTDPRVSHCNQEMQVNHLTVLPEGSTSLDSLLKDVLGGDRWLLKMGWFENFQVGEPNGKIYWTCIYMIHLNPFCTSLSWMNISTTVQISTNNKHIHLLVEAEILPLQDFLLQSFLGPKFWDSDSLPFFLDPLKGSVATGCCRWFVDLEDSHGW